MIATPITTPCRDGPPMLQPKLRSRHHVAIHVAISWSSRSGPDFHQIANRLPHQPHRIRTLVRSLENAPAPDPGRLVGVHRWAGCGLPPPRRTDPNPRRRFWSGDPIFGAQLPELGRQLPELGCKLPEFGRKSRP